MRTSIAREAMMIVGTVKEIKNHEYRAGLTPESIAELRNAGHIALVERGAGAGIGATDEDYRASGAEILSDAAAVFAQAEMVIKVKKPQPVERAMLRPGQILFTYLHLAPDREQTSDLLRSGAICIAYETGCVGSRPVTARCSEHSYLCGGGLSW